MIRTFDLDCIRKTGYKKSIKTEITVGGSIIIIFICFAFFGKFAYSLGLYKYSPTKTNLSLADIPPSNSLLKIMLDRSKDYNQFYINENKETIDKYYLIGTDVEGRDIFIRVMDGAATYLIGGSIAIIIALVLGLILGAITGYYQDKLISEVGGILVSVIESFPAIVLLIIISFVYNFSFWALMLTIGLIYSTRFGRIIKSKIEVLKNNDFIEAARELGLSDFKIIFKHIIWFNCKNEILVQMIYIYAAVILVEASLGYIGYGVVGYWVSWGKMIYDGIGGKSAIKLMNGRYWEFLPPAVATIFTIWGFNLLANGISKKFKIKDNN